MSPHGDGEQVPGPKYLLGKAERFRSVYPTGAYGGIESSGAHTSFYADRIDPEIDENAGEMRVGGIVRDLTPLAGLPGTGPPTARLPRENLFYLPVVLYDEWRVELGKKPGTC